MSASWIASFCEIKSFCRKTSSMKVEKVIYPRPPTCIRTMMTINPKREKCTPVSKVTRPVTQVAEFAVKYESRKLVGVPCAEETGSEVFVPKHPQITCAYGAAIYAKEAFKASSTSSSKD